MNLWPSPVNHDLFFFPLFLHWWSAIGVSSAVTCTILIHKKLFKLCEFLWSSNRVYDGSSLVVRFSRGYEKVSYEPCSTKHSPKVHVHLLGKILSQWCRNLLNKYCFVAENVLYLNMLLPFLYWLWLLFFQNVWCLLCKALLFEAILLLFSWTIRSFKDTQMILVCCLGEESRSINLYKFILYLSWKNFIADY